MYQYLVHAERKGIRAWEFSTYDDRRAFVVYNSNSNKQEAAYTDFVGMETWYADNEESAKLMAKEISRKIPGIMVYIAKVEQVCQSPLSNPVISEVSKKGILPK